MRGWHFVGPDGLLTRFSAGHGRGELGFERLD
jgi:hypothetical protein